MVMDDLIALQRRWALGRNLSDEEFSQMREMESAARHSRRLPEPKGKPAAGQIVAPDNPLPALLARTLCGARMSRDELLACHADAASALTALVRRGKLHEALEGLTQYLGAVSVRNRLACDALQDRITALEPEPVQEKPRHRVPAIMRPMA
jgi:hypothetical protein